MGNRMEGFTKWLKKVEQWLFHREKEKVVIKNTVKKHYGRLDTVSRSAESKIIHHYPKQGNFRFPIIEDEKPVKNKQITVTPRNENIKNVQEKKEENYEKKELEKNTVKKFSNNQFKRTDIPSPIYGFNKRNDSNKEGQKFTKLLEPSSVNVAYDSKVSMVEEQSIHVEPRLPKQLQEIPLFESVKYSYPEKDINSTRTGESINSVIEQMLMQEKKQEVNLVEQEQKVLQQEKLNESEEHEAYQEEHEVAQGQEVYPEEHEVFQEEHGVVQEQEEYPEEHGVVQEQEVYPEKHGVVQEQEVYPEEHEVVQEQEEYPEEHEVVQKQEIFQEEYDVERQAVHQKALQVMNQARIHGQENVEEEITEQLVKNEEDHSVKKHEEIQTARQEKSQTLKQMDRTNLVDKQKSLAIPFNVMMFTSDQQRQRKIEQERGDYKLPGIHLLAVPPQKKEDNNTWLDEQSRLLETTLENFNVNAKVVHVTKGPSVTRFEIQPAPGVKVSKITSLTDDIKLCLAAKDIRMEAPIPGKNAIGIEVPNMESSSVYLREILRRDVLQKSPSPLTVALGLDIAGQPIVTDLKKMPHGLVAGATGSGKSVCINSILISLLCKATPEEVKLLLIDPKMVELAPYNELPHLVTPVITDAKLATVALKWVVNEMERRYELFSQRGARDIGRYNELYSESNKPALPFIVVVIDELADLMMVSPQDVEESICRIAQKARACGIHLLLATQRPSVDVITGLIKANIPTRIAFSVSSQTDSRTIIDMNGAERLLGKGDMLFHENGSPKPIRVQGTFVSDDEIEKVVTFVKKQQKPIYLLENEHLMKAHDPIEQDDDLFEEACYFVLEQGGASSSSLQRKFRIGFNRAARLIDIMESKGIISESMGSKPRNILMSPNEFEEVILQKRID